MKINEITGSKDKTTKKHASREGKLRISDIGAFLLVIQGNLGTAFLAMPYAFLNIGLLMGMIGTTLVALICTHCTYILVRCSQELCFEFGKVSMSYAETVETAFKYGAGGRFRRYSSLMRNLSNLFIFISYYGITTVYTIVIAFTFKQVLESHYEYTINIRWYLLVLTLLLVPVGIVRHTKFLVPFSALGNICLLISCSLIIYLCCNDLPSPSSRPMVVSIAKWPLFFCTAFFGMEGIGTAMPIENTIRRPDHYLGYAGVLSLGMTVAASIFLLVGSIGYLKYGDNVMGNIILNLPLNAFSETIRVLVGCAILSTYPLRLTPSMEVVWGGVRPNISEKNHGTAYYIIRILLILGTVLFAMVIPQLGPVISLVKAIGFSILGLFLPAVTETVVFWRGGLGFGHWRLWKNLILVAIAICTLVSRTSVAIREISYNYS